MRKMDGPRSQRRRAAPSVLAKQHATCRFLYGIDPPQLPPTPVRFRMTVTAQLTTNHRAHTRSSPVLHSTNKGKYTRNAGAVKSCAPDSAGICSLRYSNAQPPIVVHYHVLPGEANPAWTPVWPNIAATDCPLPFAWTRLPQHRRSLDQVVAWPLNHLQTLGEPRARPPSELGGSLGGPPSRTP